MQNLGRWIGPSGSDTGIVNVCCIAVVSLIPHRETQLGLVKVNVGTSGAEIGAAFGGNKVCPLNIALMKSNDSAGTVLEYWMVSNGSLAGPGSLFETLFSPSLHQGVANREAMLGSNMFGGALALVRVVFTQNLRFC